MDVNVNQSLQECLAQNIDSDRRKAVGQYLVAFKAQLVSSHLPRVAISTVAEDKFLFGYLSALGDLVTALEAESAGDAPVENSKDGELL